MSILDEQKTPDQLRRDQWNEQYQEWCEAAAVASAFPSRSGINIVTVYEPGRKPRRHYFQTIQL